MKGEGQAGNDVNGKKGERHQEQRGRAVGTKGEGHAGNEG